ncbi:MAG: glycosyltransferase family 39 protein [Deltaproteobacteria bacterium]|nr:glycosyltransferase family 39 protein [Deltaproteobacteria bacterium]
MLGGEETGAATGQTPHLWRFVGLTAAILTALAAQQLVTGKSAPVLGWLLFAAAAVVAALASRAAPVNPAAPTNPTDGTLPRSFRLAGAAAALCLTLLSTLWASSDTHQIAVLVLWLSAFLPATFAVLRWRITAPSRRRLAWSWIEVVALLLLVLLGALARFAWIGTLPPYIFNDEPLVGVHLLRVFRKGQVPSFFTMGWNSWSNVGLALQGILVPFFGLHTTTLRMSSALMGTLAIATTYLAGREIFDRRVAFMAAAFFAMGRTGLEFSRLGICHAQVLFFTTLAFCQWWRAVNTGRATSYLWSGIALGFCLYTYNAAHAVPLLWLGWIGLCALVNPRRIATYGRGALLTLMGFTLSTLPWLYYVTDHFTFQRKWFEFTWMARNRQVLSQIMDLWNAQGSGPAMDLLWEQVRRTWLGFNVLPAGAYGIGYRGGGMLDNVTAALFILGLAIAAVRLLRRDFFLMWWWLPTVVLGGVLTADPPATVRLVSILPCLALFAALPLDVWWQSCGNRRNLQTATTAATAVLLLLAGWNNWRTYFIELAASPLDETSDVIRRIERLPHNTTLLSIGSEHWLWLDREIAAINFAGQRVEDLQVTSDYLPIHEPMSTPLGLVLGPTQTSLARYLRTLYPAVAIEDSYDSKPIPKLRYSLARFSPQDLEARTGLRLATTGGSSEAIALDPFAPLPEALHSVGPRRWSGAVYWPTDQPATLRVDSRQTVIVRLADAAPLNANEGTPASAVFTLPRGWQTLSMEESAGAPRELSLQIEQGENKRRLSRWDLRPESRPEGLMVVYDRNGQPLRRAIEPQINSFAVEEIYAHHNKLDLAMPFVATWQGSLRIDEKGSYGFDGIGSGPFSVRLDGQLLCEVTQVVQPEDPQSCSATRDLAPGDHAIEARFDSTQKAGNTRRVFQLYWTPPGSPRELIPPTQFAPPKR